MVPIPEEGVGNPFGETPAQATTTPAPLPPPAVTPPPPPTGPEVDEAPSLDGIESEAGSDEPESEAAPEDDLDVDREIERALAIEPGIDTGYMEEGFGKVRGWLEACLAAWNKAYTPGF